MIRKFVLTNLQNAIKFSIKLKSINRSIKPQHMIEMTNSILRCICAKISHKLYKYSNQLLRQLLPASHKSMQTTLRFMDNYFPMNNFPTENWASCSNIHSVPYNREYDKCTLKFIC